MKLFVFEHCPFCIKAMMVAGYKKLAIEQVFLQNHDINARIEKVGANLVPILQKEDGSYMAESLDIAAYLDQSNNDPIIKPAVFADQIASWNTKARHSISHLLYPRWTQVDLQEFQCQEAKDWFNSKKAAMVTVPFSEALANSAEYLNELNAVLTEIDWLVLPSQRNNELSYDDVNLYPFLRNLTVVKGVVFPQIVQQYIDEVTALTGINLFTDVAV